MANAAPTGETHVVIGGSGMLGSAIVRLLKERGETKVFNLDLREPPKALEKDGVPFTSVDISSFRSVNDAISKIKPNVIHHTASPLATGTPNKSLFQKVNVQGTMNIIESCQRNDVSKLIFTSSSSVAYTGEDNINVDERMPYAEKPIDPYSETKAEAERLVLLANTDTGALGLKTVSLRPAGIFGPYDRQAITGFLQAYKTGKYKVQIGGNMNLVDVTYVDNIAHAHLLAADRLGKEDELFPVELLGTSHLIQRRTGLNEKKSFLDRGVPTSKERPDVSGATDYARRLNTGSETESLTADLRPVVRNKFDQFFHLVNPEVKSAGNPLPELVNLADDKLSIGGQIFFITNNEPIPFWDFPRALWKEYDSVNGAVDLNKVWTLPKSVASIYAEISGWIAWSTGRTPLLDELKVKLICGKRFHNIEKARRLLGYEPIVGMEEAIKRSIAWYKQDEAAKAHKDPFDT